jgi:type IV secretory pathway VirB3-like protein
MKNNQEIISNDHLENREVDQNSLIKNLIAILAIVGAGLIAAIGKKATMDLGIPGHSALLWLGAMIAGRSIIKRDGAGFAIGLMTGVWAVPVGLNHTMIQNMALYGLVGAALDLVMKIRFFSDYSALSLIIAGGAAHMVKFVFIMARATLSVTFKNFLIVGVVNSAILHLIFGLTAGLAAFGLVSLLHSGARMVKKQDSNSLN